MNIVLAGAAGQGIQTVETLLVNAFKRSGLYVFASREYMSRVRGGINSTAIRVSSKPIRAFEERIDLLIPLNELAIPHLHNRITKETMVLGEKKFLDVGGSLKFKHIPTPFTEIADELGSKIYANIIALGVISFILKSKKNELYDLISERFQKKGDSIVIGNKRAIDKGYEIGKELESRHPELKKFEVNQSLKISTDLILDGTQAIGLGAIAGGCNYECFYPMAPSTGIGTFLAQNALKFGIIVDQSEDELSVINKALGASYAGARSLVTTSGGGFSLMTEGISLAGMMELPIVVVCGMRPGPATGMPTRTSQEDLNLVLYAGAGFFPRIVFAPGTIEDAFYLTHQAFNMAQRYQVPAFVLTDQYLVDSYYNLKDLPLDKIKVEQHIVQTDKNYKRYQFTEKGIQARGIPGWGEGLVDADSHEHDEHGNITENEDIRNKKVEKRFRKFEMIQERIIRPEFIGNKDNYEILIISWGSNYYLIKEALEKLDRADIGFLYFKQVFPVHPCLKDYLCKAKVRIAIEQNPTGQFAKLVENESQIKLDHRILKYSGHTFSVEELTEKITQFVQGGVH